MSNRTSADAAAVPAPTGAGHDATPIAAPEGDTAISIALVQRAQAGDAEAFGQLYDKYVDQVYRYVLYRVASSQVAEDLTSETFLRALRRISSFTWQGRDVGAWFVTIARNLIADHYKSGRYRLEMTSDDVSTVSGSKPVTSPGPENEVMESMQNKVLLEAVKQLNPEQQECIVLRFLQGLSVTETAQIMGKNDGAIKALQYRAIRTLGRLLPEGVEL
jgi:RNA polymerase sigma-70 factor (ECF subfamily)